MKKGNRDKIRERMDKALAEYFAKSAVKILNEPRTNELPESCPQAWKDRYAELKKDYDKIDQPLTSSIWGKRINQIANEYLDKVPVKIHDPEFKYLKSFGIKIKDKWYKELWWSIIEFIRRNK